MTTLTIFANFFIDTEERFLRMQDSFTSFKSIKSDNWVINIRGKYRLEAMSFLKNNLGEKLIVYELNSPQGWFYDTKQMLSSINNNYILFWIEDHINLANTTLLDKIVLEMDKNCLDVMRYSWWCHGIRWKRYQNIKLTHGKYIDYFEQNELNNKTIQKNGLSHLISCVMVFKKSLFHKIILTSDQDIENWPKETPFNFEKKPFDIKWLPVKVALPRQELFASIDDDAGFKNYCLQSRNLYPTREGRKSYAVKNYEKKLNFIQQLLKIFIKIKTKIIEKTAK
ncbi:MAG: hypothetical protein KAV41_00055 [Candidatus Pacebacteria bacterium]|nr:hypothetical protein [Candidatus Paceibacterota bacterium]